MKKNITLFCAVAIIGTFVGGCSKAKLPNDNTVAAAPVEAAFPMKKKLELWDSYTARISSEYSVDIKAQVGGYLKEIHFKDGDYVKKGDLLFTIDRRPYQASVNAVKARIAEIKARIVLAKSNVERAKTLVKTKSISQENYETRESELLRANAALMNAEAELQIAEINLDFTELRAPISGVVSERRIDAGNLIPSGASPILAKIVSKDKIYVYFEVSESDLAKYMDGPMADFIKGKTKSGPAVKVVPTGSSKTYNGTVTYVDNAIDPNSSTLRMRAEVLNDDGALISGMFADLKLRTSGEREFLVLPEAVVFTDLLTRYVVVIDKNNTVKFVPVEVGDIVNSDMRIIKSGISENDIVLIKGISRVSPGSKAAPKMINLDK